MHPRNIDCITAARIDCCCLANNHVLDWGYDGLAETLRTLDAAGIAHTGAGRGEMSAVNGFETLRSRPWVAKWAYSLAAPLICGDSDEILQNPPVKLARSCQ
jgi:hypothetical protein